MRDCVDRHMVHGQRLKLPLVLHYLSYTDGVEEDLAERLTEQAIDDEVDGRVQHDQNVAEPRVVVVEETTAPLHVGRGRPEDLVDERRRLATDEDEHDDDDAARDVVRAPALAAAGQRSLPESDDAHGTDQSDV